MLLFREVRRVKISISGLGETGVEVNRRFLIPKDGSAFQFTEGRYRIDMFAKLFGGPQPNFALLPTLEIPRETSALLEKSSAGLYFDGGQTRGATFTT